MERLIPVTNQIRDALTSVQLNLGVDLPEIAVVGGQSTGKSSLLEGLVGRSFLPTGTGVVTRRPLILRLSHTPGPAPAAAPEGCEWGEFQHLPGQRFEDFDAIRDEIARETERVCGQRQVISPSPIVLTISSPKVIDLTLIDLPGITHVPVGDQPQDIEVQIRRLVMDHIGKRNCLILAVVAGNADLATADALAAAREVDPEGQRTLGVLTKLDLIEHGVDALAVLEGRTYPLRLGFVGVVCRSFRDVQRGKGVAQQLQAETQFFHGHPAYRGIADRCGICHLAKRLNGILMEHIRLALPAIKRRALEYIHEYEAELRSHGESASGQSQSEQGVHLLGLFNKFSARYGDALEGKIAGQRGDLNGTPGQLVGRARIDFIFRDVFASTVQDFDCFSGLPDDEIRVAIRNAMGSRATLFVPEAAFELLVRKQIAKLQMPSLQCAELVFDELQRCLLLSELPEFRRLPSLREHVFGVVRDILQRSLEPTNEMIRDLIEIELAYINTTHPDFASCCGDVQAAATSAGHQVSQVEATHEAAGVGEPDAGPRGLPPPVLAGGAAPAWVGIHSGNFFSSLTFMGHGSSWLHKFNGVPAWFPSLAPAAGGNGGLAPLAPGPAPLGMAAAGARSHRGQMLKAGTGTVKLPQVPQTIMPAGQPPSHREYVELSLVKRLLDSYLALVKKNVADSIPKAVMFFMVNPLKDAIQSECVARLYKEDLFHSLLQEAPDVQDRREQCQAQLRALQHVVEVTEQVRDCTDA